MRIVLEVTPGQVNNLPEPLRSECLQQVSKNLTREGHRLEREIGKHEQMIQWFKQQQRDLGHWEEMLG